MEIERLIKRCLLFSKSSLTNKDHPSTNAVKVECPFKYDTVRYKNSNSGIRVAIGPGVQNLYYDKLSKELIIRKIESSAKLKLDRLFKSLNLNKIQNAFFLWRDQSSRLRVKNRVAPTSEITVERTVANTLWSSNILKSRRHSAGILKRLFLEYYERTIKRRFSFWKRYTHKRRYLLIRFFDKWSIKTSRIMLNRVTMTRFMYILEKTLSQSKKSRLRNGFLQFKSQCELIRMMRKVKLLFTCWKTCVRALIAGRGRQLHYFFLSWKSEIASRKEDAVEKSLSIEQLKMKRFFRIILTKFNRRKLLRGVLNFRLHGCRSAWQKLKERTEGLSIVTEDLGGTRAQVLSPHLAMDLGPDNESCHGIGQSSLSFASTLKSKSMETARCLKASRGDARSPSPTPHTPSRCTVRHCIACCRKAMPRSSPQGSLLRSSLDGSYLKSSLDGSLLKATPHPQLSPQLEDIEKKNRRDSRAFLRFTPEFSARQLPANPFSLIGTYIAVDEGPVLTKSGSAEERQSEIGIGIGSDSDHDRDIAPVYHEVMQGDYGDEGDEGDSVDKGAGAGAAVPHTPVSAKRQVPDLALSLGKNKNKDLDSAQKGRINTSTSTSKRSSGAQHSKRKNVSRPFASPFSATGTRNLSRSGSKVPAMHSLAAEDIDIELCRRDDDVRVDDKVKHVVFRNKSRDTDELDDSGEGRAGAGAGVRVMSRLEANFIKRLSIVQKLDNDFVVRKYCVNMTVVD